jgi:hypothetical protein
MRIVFPPPQGSIRLFAPRRRGAGIFIPRMESTWEGRIEGGSVGTRSTLPSAPRGAPLAHAGPFHPTVSTA